MTRFERHEAVWTRNKAARFWDLASAMKPYQDLYFSRQVGPSLVRYLRRNGVVLRGEILDFGCGPGHLLEILLQAGFSCRGVDFSAESVRRAGKSLSSYDKFRGVILAESLPTPLASDAFEVLFLTETVEHLLDSDLQATLIELGRLAKPGGFLVITTPNEEDLEQERVICPDCGCVFHRMQHVRSWSADSLSAIMAEFGFERVLCESTYLAQATWQSRLRVLAARLLRWKMPNLVYIGRKKDGYGENP